MELTGVTNNIKSDISSMRGEFRQLKGVVSAIQTKQGEIDAEVTSLQSSLTFHTNQQDDLSKQVESLTAEMKDMATTVDEVKALKLELNSMQQKERQQNLEIRGIPELKSEKLPDILVKIATYLEVDLKENDVIQVHRVQPMKKTDGQPKNVVPKTVVAKLSSTLIRDTIISACRKNKGVTTANIGMDLPDKAKPLFINEHLTPYNKMLHKKTREAAELKNYRFVWVTNGNIFCRKEDKAGLIRIREESDLVSILPFLFAYLFFSKSHAVIRTPLFNFIYYYLLIFITYTYSLLSYIYTTFYIHYYATKNIAIYNFILKILGNIRTRCYSHPSFDTRPYILSNTDYIRGLFSQARQRNANLSGSPAHNGDLWTNERVAITCLYRYRKGNYSVSYVIAFCTQCRRSALEYRGQLCYRRFMDHSAHSSKYLLQNIFCNYTTLLSMLSVSVFACNLIPLHLVRIRYSVLLNVIRKP